ncbi:type IV secretion protein DotU [Psychromonas sp. Urea-02u-13]|nr:type IV secretion protein DotU [Psychromonas sp. Urea-02u-13]
MAGGQSPPQITPNYQPQATEIPRENVPRDLSGLNGLNPLVNAASTLLAVFSKTRDALNHPNVGGLHQQLDREIKNFEIKAKSEGIKENNVVVARYLLCTILDEAVLNTPWGAESAWNQRTLLSIFHNETAGGEKFFAILDRLRSSPSENIEVLELAYICLSLGYEGKYRVVSRGREHLEQLRDDIFHIIRSYRGEYERALSPSWKGIGNSHRTLANYVPMWVIASIIIGMMALTFSGFRYWLDQSSNEVRQQFVDVQSQLMPEKKNTSVVK